MAQNLQISAELTELESSLATVSPIQVFQVPNGYFDGLAAEILLRARASGTSTVAEELAGLSPLLSQLSRQTPYTVPTGYFESLEESLPFYIDQPAEEELEMLSPLLSGLKKQMPYTVPDGYFDTISNPVKEKDIDTGARVISLGQRKWFRYAAAAIVVGFIATSTVIFVTKKAKVDPAINSYAWVEKSMKKVSTEDIDGLVELAKEEPVVTALDNTSVIKSLLNDVSDKEIQEFLNDTGSPESENEDDLFLN